MAGTAFGAYVVDLDGGDRMTVDSYWEEGGRMHLMRGGVDLNVPKSRVRSIKPATGDDDDGYTAGVGQQPAPTAPSTRGDATADDEDLEAKQRRIERHLLKVQRERFEARNRGESNETLERIDREFKRTQQRRQDVLRARTAPND